VWDLKQPLPHSLQIDKTWTLNRLDYPFILMPPSVLNQQIINIVILLVNVIFPTIEWIFHATHHSIRQLDHTSILSSKGWVQELLHGHPECIHWWYSTQKHTQNPNRKGFKCFNTSPRKGARWYWISPRSTRSRQMGYELVQRSAKACKGLQRCAK
jgi:hypothetical protein